MMAEIEEKTRSDVLVTVKLIFLRLRAEPNSSESRLLVA
jgi:hypothetical protein